MKLPTYLTRRGKSGVFYARLRVPADLVGAFGRNEFTKSLKTSDMKEAQRRARPLLETWEREFVHVRNKEDIGEADIAAATREHYDRQLKWDEIVRSRKPSNSHLEQQRDLLFKALRQEAKEGKFDWGNPFALLARVLEHPGLADTRAEDGEALQIRLSELRKHLAEGEIVLVEHLADDVLNRLGVEIERDDPRFRQLCQSLLRAEVEYLERVRERNLGDYRGQPQDPLLVEDGPRKLNNTSFVDIIREQQKLSERGIGESKSASTIRKYTKCVEQFACWRGSDRVATVTKPEVERWRDELLDVYSRKTVRDKISTIRTVLEWGQRQTDGALFDKRFPLDTLQLPIATKVDSATRTYSLEMAREILSASRNEVEAYKRWIPWILAYSGARIDEIVQLEKADFFQYEGHWFFHIRVGGTRSTKTGLERRVPVHSALVEEGLIRFVDGSSGGRLFKSPRVAQNLRDWIREDLLKGYPKPRPAPAHGFRHLFEDLRRARLDIEAANYITGRANKGSAETYGKSRAMLPALAKQMEKIPRILD